MKVKITHLALALLVPFFAGAQGDNPGTPQVRLLGENQVINCTSNPVPIGVRIKNWQPGFQYLWSNGRIDSIIEVQPSQTTVYNITVTNPSIGFSATRSLEVKVFNAPVIASDEHIEVDKQTCPGHDIKLGVDAIGGYAPYTFSWNTGHNEPAPIVNPTKATNYKVTITDACGSSALAHVHVSFEEHDPVIAPAPRTVEFTCEKTPLKLEVALKDISGGVGYGYTYAFDASSINEPLLIETKNGLVLNYEVSDACGIQKDYSRVALTQELIQVPEVTGITICKGEEATITKSEDEFYFWDGETMHTEYTTTFEQDQDVDLVFIDMCGVTHGTKRQVDILEVDAQFDTDLNNLDRKVIVHAPSLEEGSSITWFLNGAEISTETDPEFDLTESNEHEIILEVENATGCTETSSRTLVLQDGVEMPSAFSPNGDGLNDRFSIRFEDELKNFDLNIFDRWGQLIYKSNDQYFEWDGNVGGAPSPLTSYAYILRAETVNGRKIEKRGTISTLIID